MSSIALAVICKNERENFPKLLESVRDCFDEIHVTDTGSTDGTIELLEEYRQSNPAHAPLFLHHFSWINDFGAARNASFNPVKTDYIMWMDLDDVLLGRENFIDWKNKIMPIANLWLATYHYGGLTPDGKSSCEFMRERVVKNDGTFKWRYFVHEGLMSEKPINAHFVTSWSVCHKRTEEDQKKDRKRNLKLFEGKKLDARMRYYYGKELFENNQPLEAFKELLEASTDETLELHDRILSIQYAVMSATQCNQLDKAISIALQGIHLDPTRAEFHVAIGDAFIKQNKFNEAIPFFRAALGCKPPVKPLYSSAIFKSQDAYEHYASNQLARLYFHTNQWDLAKKVLEEARVYGPNAENLALWSEIDKVSSMQVARPISQYTKTRDIAISCCVTPIGEWDESTLAQKGIGGSETAVIHMARCLHKRTGRTVRVFNERKFAKEMDGVIYQPLTDMPAYFKDTLPDVHISWRHAHKLTPAKTFVWCHDLLFQGIEGRPSHYEAVFALSDFHKEWLSNLYAVPKDKILVTRNGIDPKRFEFLDAMPPKNPNKIIYSSSPDRGLKHAIEVMDEVIKDFPDVELHAYYGFDNMRKMGRTKDVEELEAMIAARPFVKFRGNLSQKELADEFHESSIWLYPTNFLETFCITAIEAICCGVYPVVRKYGALPDTLKVPHAAGMASVIDADPEKSILPFANEVKRVLKAKSWESVKVDASHYSWEGVAEDWVRLLGLES